MFLFLFLLFCSLCWSCKLRRPSCCRRHYQSSKTNKQTQNPANHRPPCPEPSPPPITTHPPSKAATRTHIPSPAPTTITTITTITTTVTTITTLTTLTTTHHDTSSAQSLRRPPGNLFILPHAALQLLQLPPGHSVNGSCCPCLALIVVALGGILFRLAIRPCPWR
ncbi:hypothetical protein DM02DRAFT_169663 [Periconia macrospinosa]|uniref:Uncharacterized protein n=1 Tax=Periconia macrospinosa TaxID=97972 RepID=A0A2V1DAD4_9PLEO|nr:hypothetical protein DM02DRAFT_169663 [Periconia macrospinosa]